MAVVGWHLLGIVLLLAPEPEQVTAVRIPLTESREVDVAEVVARLAEHAGLRMAREPDSVRLSFNGLAAALSRQILSESLGPEVRLSLQPRELVVMLNPGPLDADRRAELARRLH